MRPFHFTLLVTSALVLSACPAVPPVVPIVDAIAERIMSDAQDGPPDVGDAASQPRAQATEFGPCESASDCLTYPNSASVCDFQTCALQCVPGFANCDRETFNGCEQSLSTPAHCAGCDTPCAPDNAFGSCATGLCLVAACNLGFGDCDGRSDNGCESLLVTVSDCGACGVPCQADNAEMTCDGGECAIKTCAPGFGDCDALLETGCEVNVVTPSRCGDCETSCAAGQGCDFDHCSPSTSEPFSVPASAVAVASDASGALYVSATFGEDIAWPTEEDVLNVGGDSDVLLLKRTQDGLGSWAMRFGGLNSERAGALVVNAEGQVAFTGTFRSGLKFDGALLAHTGGDDVFLLSVDSSGEPRFGLGLGGLGDDSAQGLALGPNSEFALMAKAQSPASFGGEVLTSADGESLGVVALYSALGTPLWSQGLTSAAELQMIAITCSPEGHVHVLVDSKDAPASLEGVALGQGVMVLTWSGAGTFVAARSIQLSEAYDIAHDAQGRLWVAGLDAEGAPLIQSLESDAPLTIAVPSVQRIALGPDDTLYVAGLTSGAFDVGLGPVVVSTSYAARYDLTTGDARWFVDLGELDGALALTATPSGVVVGREALLELVD